MNRNALRDLLMSLPQQVKLPSTKNVVKEICGRFFRALLAGGCFDRFTVILMYHRVVENLPGEIHDPAMLVRASVLNTHLEELSRFVEIVPLHTVVAEKVRKGRLCAITFDDGWLDNFEYAFPVLSRNNVPATVFVPVAMIGTDRRFWFETLFGLARAAKRCALEREFVEYFQSNVPSWRLGHLDEGGLSDLVLRMKVMNPVKVDKMVEEACGTLKLPFRQGRSVINWDEMAEMGRSGISFGTHGLNHHVLSALDYETKRREIVNSLKTLHNRERATIPFFTYPNGDWDDDCIKFLSVGGYRGALTTRLGIVGSTMNPFLLSRVAIHDYVTSSSGLFWFRILQAILAGS